MVPLSDIEIEKWTGNEIYTDYFFYYKAIILLVLTSLLAFAFLYLVFSGRVKVQKNLYYFPLLFFILSAVLSAIFSENSSISFWGFADRHEGMFALLSYMIIYFIVLNLPDDEWISRKILSAMLLSAAIVAMIGLFQFFGYDLFRTPFGHFIVTAGNHGILPELFYPANTVYSTLYHSNYVGSLLSMAVPLCFTLLLLLENKRQKILLGILCCLFLFVLIASRSEAGMLGAGAGCIALLFFIGKLHQNAWRYFIILGAVSVLFLFFVSAYLNIKKGINFKSLFESGMEKNDENNILIRNLSLRNNSVKIETSDMKLNMEINNGQVIFSDGKGGIVPFLINITEGRIECQDLRYRHYNFLLKNWQNLPVIEIICGKLQLDFAVSGERFYFLDLRGRLVKEIVQVEHWGFEGYEKFASCRGYIWSRSLPLLKKTCILGFGPDNFALNFPNDDYSGKYNAYGKTRIIVDKPHNFYLQTALNTGLISLIALMVLFGIYFINSIRFMRTSGLNFFNNISVLAVFVSVIAYLVTSFFNDSVVAVAPLFWMLLGIGTASAPYRRQCPPR